MALLTDLESLRDLQVAQEEPQVTQTSLSAKQGKV